MAQDLWDKIEVKPEGLKGLDLTKLISEPTRHPMPPIPQEEENGQ